MAVGEVRWMGLWTGAGAGEGFWAVPNFLGDLEREGEEPM
mgnify:CR=1